MTDFIRKYPSNFGKWYVQVLIDSASVEFAFDSEPSDADINAAVEAYLDAQESVVILEAENGEQIQ